MAENLCPVCAKPIFRPRSKWCSKSCGSAAWYQNNKDHVKARVKVWAQGHPEQNKASKQAWEQRNPRYGVLKKYHITSAAYDQLFEEQGGCCAVCGTTSPTPRAFFDVDHDHQTGQVRGLLCRSCNIMVGLAGDSIFTLRNACNYLSRVSI